MTPRISPLPFLLLGALAALACGEAERVPVAVANVDSRGLITSIRSGSSPGSGALRIEGPPRPEVRYAKADVAVLASTRIVARTGTGDRPAVFADLELGDLVQIQFQGPVAKSSPVRAVARQIVILEKARGFAPDPQMPPPRRGPDTGPYRPDAGPEAGTAPLTSDLPATPTTDLEPPPPDVPREVLPAEPPQEDPDTAVLRDVRTGDQQTFDRLVFEIAGERLPQYKIGWVSHPTHCGSGEAARIDGRAFLQVRLSPARAHTDAGTPTMAVLQRKVRLPVIREIRQTCDFEGDVTWVVGLAARKEYHVSELEAPARLVIDIAR